jgi:hypothetical protein
MWWYRLPITSFVGILGMGNALLVFLTCIHIDDTPDDVITSSRLLGLAKNYHVASIQGRARYLVCSVGCQVETDQLEAAHENMKDYDHPDPLMEQEMQALCAHLADAPEYSSDMDSLSNNEDEPSHSVTSSDQPGDKEDLNYQSIEHCNLGDLGVNAEDEDSDYSAEEVMEHRSEDLYDY